MVAEGPGVRGGTLLELVTVLDVEGTGVPSNTVVGPGVEPVETVGPGVAPSSVGPGVDPVVVAEGPGVRGGTLLELVTVLDVEGTGVPSNTVVGPGVEPVETVGPGVAPSSVGPEVNGLSVVVFLGVDGAGVDSADVVGGSDSS